MGKDLGPQPLLEVVDIAGVGIVVVGIVEDIAVGDTVVEGIVVDIAVVDIVVVAYQADRPLACFSFFFS